jgi:hypothetical protein
MQWLGDKPILKGQGMLALLLTGGTLKATDSRRLQAHGPEGWPNQTVVISGRNGRVDSVILLQDKYSKERRTNHPWDHKPNDGGGYSL